MLLDSNIIIYAVLPEHAHLRTFISTNAVSISAISQIEVLGYRQLSSAGQKQFRRLFQHIEVFPIDNLVIESTIALRQQHKISLGDAIIGATALIHKKSLMTRNKQDFDWIPDLTIINPFEESP